MALTAENITTKLQIYNCCAAYKANEYAAELKKGRDCTDKLEELNLLMGYINSIKGYDPDNENNCITLEEVEFILNACGTICDACSCKDYVNFQ